MKRIFLSCSAADRDSELAERLKEALERLRLEQGDINIWPSTIHGRYEDVPALIRSCDALVAIIAKDRSNVLFEIGVAVGAGKPVILLADADDVVPNELRAYPCIGPTREGRDITSATVRFLRQLRPEKAHWLADLHAPDATLRTCVENPKLLDAIDARTFERLLASWFESEGCTIDWTPEHHLTGCDFYAKSSDGKRWAVQAKKFDKQSRVSIDVVRSLLNTTAMSGSAGGLIIATCPFTSSAMALALESSPKVRLLTLDELLHRGALRGDPGRFESSEKDGD
jgi:HJR/Mrr/RecB family endonuclease